MDNGIRRTDAQVRWDRQAPEHLDRFNDTRVAQQVLGASPLLIGRDQHQLLQQSEVMLDERSGLADGAGQFAEGMRWINYLTLSTSACRAGRIVSKFSPFSVQ